MKLWKKISWLRSKLQEGLFFHLEECWEQPLTEKEQRLVTILELVKVERYVPMSSLNQWVGGKILERKAISRQAGPSPGAVVRPAALQRPLPGLSRAGATGLKR